jgi:hypothetical protein
MYLQKDTKAVLINMERTYLSLRLSKSLKNVGKIRTAKMCSHCAGIESPKGWHEE